MCDDRGNAIKHESTTFVNVLSTTIPNRVIQT
jgi:hypothetical protein